MQKAYNIQSVTFHGDYLIVEVDNVTIRALLSQVSEKLANANEQERNSFTISPSGYGIHWPKLDEDLSVNGLKCLC